MLSLLALAMANAVPENTNGLHASCAEVRDEGGIAEDGDQTLALDSGNVTVYCYMMGAAAGAIDGAPFAYITLSQPNTAQWITSSNGSGTMEAQPPITTTFYKVRIDEATLKLHTGDCKLVSLPVLSCIRCGVQLTTWGCVVFSPAAAVTFATTQTVQGLDAAAVCGDTQDVTPSCRNEGADGWAVPFGMAGVCPFSTTSGSASPAETATTATAAIDLSGTGLRLTAGSTTHLSQFVHLGDLAKVIQPTHAAGLGFRATWYGVNASTATPSGSTLTGRVEYGVRPGMEVSGSGQYIQEGLQRLDWTFTGDETACVGSTRPVGLFCDFVMNEDWVSDLDMAATARGIPRLDNPNPGFFCENTRSWLAAYTPADDDTYRLRLSAIASGGYGICTCIEEDDAGCANTTCGWTTAAAEVGYQRHHYDESTATQCTDTEYEVSDDASVAPGVAPSAPRLANAGIASTGRWLTPLHPPRRHRRPLILPPPQTGGATRAHLRPSRSRAAGTTAN